MTDAHAGSGPGATADSRYRLADGLLLRVVGSQLAAFGLVVVVLSVLVAVTEMPGVVAVVVGLCGIVTAAGTAWWLRTRAAVVALRDDGYAVRLVRGVGVRAAGWSEVSEVVTTSPEGIACVVLRLSSGGSTTLPMAALAGDREAFVRDLQRRLQSARGLRSP